MNENKTYKEYKNKLDISPIIQKGDSTNAVVYSFDLDTSKFTYELKMNGQPLSLANASEVNIVLYFGGDDPEKYPKANLVGVIEDKLNGKVSFIMPKQYLGFDGQVLGEIDITFKNGQSLTVGYFSFVMKPSFINGSIEIEQQVYVEQFEDLKNLIGKQSEDINKILVVMQEDIKESNAKVDEIKDLIVQNDVLKKAEAGTFEEFREQDDTIISKMKNEFTDRGVNVKWFGAKGDGVTDDTDAIKKAVEFCEQGKILYFPQGDYLTTDTIVIDKAIHLNMQGKIICNHDKTGIRYLSSKTSGTFGAIYDNGITINSSFNVIRKKEFSQISSSIGIEIVNCFNGKFDLKNITEHYLGVKLIAKKIGTGYSAITYCNFRLGRLNNYFENLRGICEGSGWLTQNTFFGGNWTCDNKESSTRHVTFENNGTSVIDANLFFNCSFEGFVKECITFKKVFSNTFYNCRFEMPTCEKLFVFSKDSRFNVISNCFGVSGFMRDNKFSDNEDSKHSTGNKVEFNDYLLGDINYYDGIFYITPIRNTDEHYGNTTNGVKLGNIPKDWTIKFNVNGLIENLVTSSSDNTVDGKVTVDFNRSDKIYVASTSKLTTCHINIDRICSKFLYLAMGLDKDKEILLTSNIGIVDKTGNEKKFKYGMYLMELYYDVYRNTIVITRTF